MEAKELLEKYRTGNCTAAEKAIVETWYLKFEQEEGNLLSDTQLSDATDRIWNSMPIHETEVLPMRKRSLWPAIGAVAAVVLMGSLALYFFNPSRLNPSKEQLSKVNPAAQPVILPGGNKAVLTLADGKQITLDGAGNGKLAEQPGITITKTKDGQLVYTASSSAVAAKGPAMNMIATPKGGQYQVNLPDGTKVWLNAASSLRYPTAFTAGVRQVSLTGEAYFEVAKVRTEMPFKVLTTTQTVEVLGTHFNVNSYTDEPAIKTTLLEGAVKVMSPSAAVKELILKPGQQSVLRGDRLNVAEVNEDEVIAWKNGMFRFRDADLQTVMRSVARWYDVQVNYEGTLPVRQFSGEIHRNINLSEVLDILSFFKVHFRVDGKTITVTK
ncbi:FecR protein [Pedobacter steynii]|uniref:FecR protein n=1 Tax=Pedobacter steynii TaxID=430522 RepID=A0A1G9MWR4_9SPHI|nr:FecR domain-containing protein [Pedobacter steynii]NQX39481.1 FecR domain-containing protein [Pedobacter steynii]SDL78357.1 FecR protein [Pedobacter steynii]